MLSLKSEIKLLYKVFEFFKAPINDTIYYCDSNNSSVVYNTSRVVLLENRVCIIYSVYIYIILNLQKIHLCK